MLRTGLTPEPLALQDRQSLRLSGCCNHGSCRGSVFSLGRRNRRIISAAERLLHLLGGTISSLGKVGTTRAGGASAKRTRRLDDLCGLGFRLRNRRESVLVSGFCTGAASVPRSGNGSDRGRCLSSHWLLDRDGHGRRTNLNASRLRIRGVTGPHGDSLRGRNRAV